PTRHALLTNEQLWLPFCSFTIHTLVHSFSGRFDLHREGRDMPPRARFALKVNDLASSLTFYVDRLGFQLIESQPDADLAVVLDPYGAPLLLAGPALEDVQSHLDEPRIVYQSGHTLDFVQEDLDA